MAIARALSGVREGLTETQVFEDAIEHDDCKVLGRSMADLVPPRVRPGRRRTLPDESGAARTDQGVFQSRQKA
jgi:hypothetical protein